MRSTPGNTPSSGLLNQAAYARHANVHPSTVCRWLVNGRIAAEPNGLIDPEKADRMRQATESPLPHHQARKEQIEAAKAEAAEDRQAEDHSPGPEKLSAALKLETYKLQKAKAERAAMEFDQLAGALVERGDVDYLLADFGNTLRTALEGLPDRLAPALAAHRGDVALIQRELDANMTQVLTEIADHIQRKLEAMAA